MAARKVHEPGALVHFRHWDAAQKPKPRRPGVVDRAVTGNLLLFYGSTFKRGGYPRDAIELDPRGAGGTPQRALADMMPGFVDEPTFFHGSLLAETPILDKGLKHLSGLGFPNDLLEDLQEQAEDRVLGFLSAWKNMAWLPARARLLDALWWKVKPDLETEVLLTLVLCDGWSVTEIEQFRWESVGTRIFLPHTAGLMAELQRESKGAPPPWNGKVRDELLGHLQSGWEELVAAATPRGRRNPFPPWERVREKIDR